MTIYDIININDLTFDDRGYADVPRVIFPNTTIKARTVDGGATIQSLWITPNEGYVLHDSNYDTEVVDEVTLEPTGEIKPGFRTTTATCGYNYDFEANPRQFYAVLRTEVPENSEIYNTPSGGHEIA